MSVQPAAVHESQFECQSAVHSRCSGARTPTLEAAPMRKCAYRKFRTIHLSPGARSRRVRSGARGIACVRLATGLAARGDCGAEGAAGQFPDAPSRLQVP